MSTYSMQVSGPSARLAMLAALGRKLLDQAHHAWTLLTNNASRGLRLARAATTTALAVIGSHSGYQLARHTARTVVATAVHLGAAAARWVGRGLNALGRIVTTAVAVVSPTAADVIEQTAQRLVVAPAQQLGNKVYEWAGNAVQAVWELSDTALVRGVTVRAAQAASIILAVHTITKGAAATRIVSALPWAMDAVVTLTNPAKAAALVAVAFVTALVVAAMRLLNGPDDEPVEATFPTPADLADVLPLRSPAARPAESDEVDYAGIAATLNVEITTDGSVLVHGIPDTLPDEIGLQVAQVAAKAATERLEKILLRKPLVNRDDRRLLTKIAREAVRGQAQPRAV